MNVFRAVLILWLVASASSKCGNPFLSRLPSSTTYNQPRIGQSRICRDVWSDEKSCCSDEGVRQHSAADADQISTHASWTMNAIKQLRVKLVSPEYRNERALNKMTQLAFLKVYQHDSEVKKFVEGTEKCWGKMRKFRKNALCYTCASDGASYFLESKMRITSHSCETMLKHCEVYFYRTIELVNGMKDLHYYLKQEGFTSLSKDAKEMGNWLERIDDLRLTHETLEYIRKYMESSGTVKKHAGEVICNKVFNVFQASFVQELWPLINLIERKTDEIIDGMKTVHPNQQNKRTSGRSLWDSANSWRITGRQLAGLDPNSDVDVPKNADSVTGERQGEPAPNNTPLAELV